MIAILDTGGANHASIQNAFRRLERESVVTLDRDTIERASHLILPCVGHAGFAMEKIRGAGLVDYIRGQVKPVLGICLGMQILFSQSEEGTAHCLGILPGNVTKLKANGNFRVPHMGWNTLEALPGKKNVLLDGIDSQTFFYFVHSFACPQIFAVTHQTAAAGGAPAISAAVREKNFFGVQFHPERSGAAGAQVLRNFLGEGVSR